MPNGFSLGVLSMIKDPTLLAAPQYKIEPAGALAMLKMGMSPGVIENDNGFGHFKTVTVKKKKRFTKAETSTTPSCDETNTQPYSENVVSVANYRQIAFHLEDETVAAMDAYASAVQAAPAGTAPAIPGLLWEFYDTLMTAASAINQGTNEDLCTLLAANIGVNRATGDALAQAINIPLATTSNPLTNGPTKIMADFMLNTMSGRPILLGAGLMHNWMLQQPAKGLDQAGIDTRIQAGGFDMFVDYYYGTTALGAANNVVAYEKDSVQLVEYMKYRGFKAGAKGTSIFGVIPIPCKMGAGGIMGNIMYDFQLKYNDCEQEFAYVDGAPSVVLQKGWNMILSKNFGLYSIPTGAYRTTDPLFGNRGSLRFNITNT
jgi:hypothetical protein